MCTETTNQSRLRIIGISIEIILSFYNFIHSFITSFFIHSLLVSVLVFCLRWNSLGDLREDAQNSLFLTSRKKRAYIEVANVLP